MLLGSVEAKTFRDRFGLAVFSGGALAVMAFVVLAIFSSFGDDAKHLVNDLPEAFVSLVGASSGQNYAVSELFSLIAPVVVLVVAISGGVGAVAGEERAQTAELLLAQPVTRRRLVGAKAGVLVVDVVFATGLFVAGFLVASAVVGTDISAAHALAAGIHLAALGVAFGMIALAVSAATGSVTTSTMVVAGLAVVADLAAALLPLVDAVAGLAKASPWYYYNGSRPLTNGVDGLHLLVLAAISVVGLAVALVTVDRRDLGTGDGRGLVAMIPTLDHLTRPRVGGVFVKALSERAVLAGIAGGWLAALAVAVSLMFDGLQHTLAEITRDLPDSVSRLVGNSDMGTAVGFMNAEILSIFAPLVVVGVAAVLGAAAVAGEQQDLTLALLLSTPLTRRRLVLEKTAAMALVVVEIAGICGVGIFVGSAVSGLGLGGSNVAAAMVHLALLGIFFGTVAVALGANASRRLAVRVTIALAVAAYFVESLLPLVHSLTSWAALSPWHYYSAAFPLARGLEVGDVAVLAGLSALALAGALVLVERRDVAA
jgi:beta-exotoxin I transport system permease protein